MDSKDTNEAKMRQREEILARRIGEALDRMNPHDAGACPDAEIIAAYAEQALGPDEAAQWEGHFAACARCRKILRVLAASADTPLAGKEVAHLGELVSAVRDPADITGRSGERVRPRFADWRMRWLAPALGVAAVLAVWFAMRPPWRTTDRGVSQTLIAQAPKEEAPPSPAPQLMDRLSEVAPQQDQEKPVAPSLDRFTGNAQTLNSPAKAPTNRRSDAGNELKKVAPTVDDATRQLQKEDNSGSLSGELGTPSPATSAAPSALPPKAKAPIGAPAPAPPPQASAQVEVPAPSTPKVSSSTSQSVTVTEATPSIETASGAPSGTVDKGSSANVPLNGRSFKSLAELRPAVEYSALLKAPSGTFLWRGGKGGIIERSTNTGKTWVTEISPSREDWIAGVAISDTVCWLVGRKGGIARTVDGEHWERVAPPAQAAAVAGKFVDWTGVTARGAQTATITASDGRKFTTTDGGKTWQMQ
jgi:hypothetical protein